MKTSCSLAALFFATLLFGGGAVPAAPPPVGVDFDAVSYAVVEDWPDMATRLSVSAWVKVPAITESQTILNRGQAGTLFTLYCYKGVVRMLVEYQPGKYEHANAPLPEANTWAHYAGTYDGETIRIYKDGKLSGTKAAPGSLPAAKAPLYIGALAPGARPLGGALDQVAVWSDVLTDEDAAKLAGGISPAEIRKEALSGHWQAASREGEKWDNAAGGKHHALIKHDGKEAAKSGGIAPFPSDLAYLGTKEDGYRGIWYMNQPSHDEYVYKYSGGLGTYCAKHKPFAVYAPAVNKTFFCYGGSTKEDSRRLIHMVSCYDHETGMVPRPTALLDKKTDDAHDNPVISMDDDGFIWIFSTSHGTGRPSYIHRSRKPYDIDAFELVPATRVRDDGETEPVTNFSYMQVWHVTGKGFLCFFTRYNYPAARTTCCMTSPDGVTWSKWQRLGAIDQGHYQVSAVSPGKAGTAFNYHPAGKGLNWRTNLYYIETPDFGKTWQTVDGKPLELPLTTPANEALVHDYAAQGLNVYMKDIRFDDSGHPIILYITSKGYESGPKNDPRTWTTARWTGAEWDIRQGMTSDNNYDMGSLYLEPDGLWRIIAPTETGPQPYNPGGEIAMWTSADQGAAWTKIKHLTRGSERNHTFVRRPVNARPEFYGLWADGHGRQPSESTLYFCDRDGNVRILPPVMDGDFAVPAPLKP